LGSDPYDWKQDRDEKRLYRCTHRTKTDPKTRKPLVVWKVRYRPTPDAHESTKTFADRASALAFLAELGNVRRSRRSGVVRPLPDRTDTFKSWALELVESKSNARTRVAYVNHVARLEEHDPGFVNMRLGMVQNKHLVTARARMINSGKVSVNTANATMDLAKQVMRDAALNNHIAPLAMDVPRTAGAPPKPTPSLEEALEMVAWAREVHRALLGSIIVLGLRGGEARGLALDQIDGIRHDLRNGWTYDPDPMAWEVRVHWQLQDGMEPVKGSRYREIAPDEAAMMLIVGHLNRFGPGPDLGQGRLVFPQLHGWELRDIVDTACRNAHGHKRFTAHSLRKVHSTTRLASGEQIKQVSWDMGHGDNYGITQAVYNAIERRHRVRGQAFQRVTEAAAAAESAHVAAAPLLQIRPSGL
jgi:integrase